MNMRRSLASAFISSAAFSFLSCQPAAPLTAQLETQSPLLTVTTPFAHSVPVPTPSSPLSAPYIVRKTIYSIDFEGVGFDARSHRLLVVDQLNGPGSAFNTARDLATSHSALVAINAGFFTPEGNPLGLVITNGRSFGTWNSASSLGSGIFAESSSGELSISRRGSASAFQSARELIQAGPLLIENGISIGGLDTEKTAVRSIILTDGGTRWWIGRTSLCTLSALGAALAAHSPAPWPIRQALNLDGGRSTDLFVSMKIPGGPLERRGILNRPVRNFLILRPR